MTFEPIVRNVEESRNARLQKMSAKMPTQHIYTHTLNTGAQQPSYILSLYQIKGPHRKNESNN